MSRLSQDAAQQILNEHNCVRARYGSAPLQWDWKLAADAQVHADRCGFWHSTKIGQLPPGQGENLSINTGAVSTRGWIDEESAYDCKNGNCRQPPCGHWTQMLWNDTERVGCAIQKCVNGTVDPDGKPAGWVGAELLVCRYSPPGNYAGQQPVGSTQCDAGAKASGCGSAGATVQVPSGGRGVGTIVPEGVAATTAAGASSYNQSGLEVWRKKAETDATSEAAALNVPLSILDMKQSVGQLIFPWRTSQMIVRQYTPQDIKYFIDTYASSQAQIDALTYKEILQAMVEIEQRRKASGNIYVRSDQRRMLDSLPPQHLSPLLTLLQGLPTFYHTALVDRFFQQLYKGNEGALARIASGQEQISSDKDESEFAKSVGGKRQATSFDFGALDEQERDLTQRFAGQISDEARKNNERVAAAIASGTATAAEAITSAYVLNAATTESATIGTILLRVLLVIAALMVLLFLALAAFAFAAGRSIADQFSRARDSVASAVGL